MKIVPKDDIDKGITQQEMKGYKKLFNSLGKQMPNGDKSFVYDPKRNPELEAIYKRMTPEQRKKVIEPPRRNEQFTITKDGTLRRFTAPKEK